MLLLATNYIPVVISHIEPLLLLFRWWRCCCWLPTTSLLHGINHIEPLLLLFRWWWCCCWLPTTYLLLSTTLNPWLLLLRWWWCCCWQPTTSLLLSTTSSWPSTPQQSPATARYLHLDFENIAFIWYRFLDNIHLQYSTAGLFTVCSFLVRFSRNERLSLWKS